MAESVEPTISDVMTSLSAIMGKLTTMEERLDTHETLIGEMQPRVSILYHDQEEKNIDEMKEKESTRDNSEEGDASENSRKARGTARKSMFQRNVEETSELSERHQIVVQRATPSHSHIFLSSTDLAEYAQFVTKWFDWEIQHGIKLEPALIVSKNVRNQLMYNNGKTDTDFNSLTPATFCSMMAGETRVGSKVQFAETFRRAMRNVRVLSWDKVRPNSHERFFQGILRRQKIFMRTFQILMEANKEHCPSLDMREFGLAQIFLDLIDKQYSKYVLAEIPRIREDNYKRLADFVDVYVAKAKTH